jgi:hypothetical protein
MAQSAATKRTLSLECSLIESKDSPLVIDEVNGVIKGARICGRYSTNCHGQKGVTEGTEYTPAAMKADFANYDGLTIYCDHDRKGNGRSVREPFGVIRHPSFDAQESCVRGDIQYYKSHDMAPRVIEDIRRGMGRYGLSHHAPNASGRVEKGWLLVESLGQPKSVDLVVDAATNRNLWESKDMSKTFKEILEARLPSLSKPRQQVVTELMEAEDMGPPLDAPIEAPPTDPDEALAAGFKAAVMAVVDDGSMDAAAKLAKIKQLLTAQEKLAGNEEPKPKEGDKPKKDDEKGGDMKESLEAEFKKLKAKDECRDLCESMDIKPSAILLESLCLLESTEKRKALLEDQKVKAVTGSRPKSGSPLSLKESKSSGNSTAPKDAKEYAARIFG